jgi:hypothetical protein
VEFPNETDSMSVSLHKIIFLVLYEVWTELYGEEFSKKEVKVESARNEMYKKTWEWALTMPESERKRLFNKLKI